MTVNEIVVVVLAGIQGYTLIPILIFLPRAVVVNLKREEPNELHVWETTLHMFLPVVFLAMVSTSAIVLTENLVQIEPGTLKRLWLKPMFFGLAAFFVVKIVESSIRKKQK